MNRTSLAVLCLCSSFALLHCGGEQKNPDTPAAAPTIAPAELPPAPVNGPDAGPPADAAPAPTAAKNDTGAPNSAKPNALSDDQIAAITDSANSTEIEEGKLARLKSKDKEVQRFAAKMIAAHEEAKKNQDKLKLPTAESALGNTLGTAAASAMNSLKSSDGAAFDKAYIDAQVDAHQKLLAALNDQLLPNVKNQDLKAYLNQIQPHVAHHLQEAQEIQQALGAKGATSAAAKPAK
jgi:putative membrane protein